MKNENFSILFFLAKKRLLKNGQAPVYLRITINGVCDEIRIKRSVPVNLWNQAKECSRGKDRNSLELNEYIRSLNLKLLTIHKELTLINAPITSKLLLGKLFGKEEEGMKLLSIFQEHNEKCRKLIDIDYADITVRRYDNCCKYLGELIKIKYDKVDVLLTEVNGELIREFEFYMKTEKACKQNTVIRYMKCLKKVTNLAIANEWMAKDPFAGIKFKEENVTKEFLEKEELEILVKKEFELERLNLVKDIFLFCSFTGLAFVDVSELKEEHIFKDNNGSMWIRKDRHKIRNRANCTCNIPLLDIPLLILEKYKNHPVCTSKGVLLPVTSNQKMNSYLKEIADFCGIKKNLTTHTARHTFATTVTLANKVSLENVSKMLGHTSTRMTQHYARVLDHSIMDDMNKVKTNFQLNLN